MSNSAEESLHRIEKITGIKPSFVPIDLKDETATKNIFKKYKDAKAFLHFTAHKPSRRICTKLLMYYKNNIYALLNILSAQIENGINGFIFSSSATVYGTPKRVPIKEESETQRPFSPFGTTKKVAEEILDDFIKSNPNFSAISLRYFNSIGAHESDLISQLQVVFQII